MIRGNNINRFLRGCSDHRDQLFCLFLIKKASLALRMENLLQPRFQSPTFNHVHSPSYSFIYPQSCSFSIIYLHSRSLTRNFYSLPFVNIPFTLIYLHIQARNQDFMWGVLTWPKWTKLPKCIFYLILFNWRPVNFSFFFLFFFNFYLFIFF